MSLQDEWGHDPSVQSMRRVFSGMEAIQKELLEQLNISSFDGRLRDMRTEALNLFERAWARAGRWSMRMGEEEVTRLYNHCILRVLRMKGIEVRSEVLQDDETFVKLIDEGLR